LWSNSVLISHLRSNSVDYNLVHLLQWVQEVFFFFRQNIYFVVNRQIVRKELRENELGIYSSNFSNISTPVSILVLLKTISCRSSQNFNSVTQVVDIITNHLIHSSIKIFVETSQPLNEYQLPIKISIWSLFSVFTREGFLEIETGG